VIVEVAAGILLACAIWAARAYILAGLMLALPILTMAAAGMVLVFLLILFGKDPWEAMQGVATLFGIALAFGAAAALLGSNESSRRRSKQGSDQK
jgi:thiol:disulfide interchange protein